MYLFELIVRWIFPNKKYEPRKKFDPFAQDVDGENEECEHIFLPIDSTGEVLACCEKRGSKRY